MAWNWNEKSMPELLILALLIGLVVMYVTEGPSDAPPTDTNKPVIPADVNTFTMATWNMEIFGITKWQKQGPQIVNKLLPYDIIFIQEIRDETGSAWNSLCSNMTGYNCYISSRAGRSSSKEQYGIIYRNWVSLDKVLDFNTAAENQAYWERPPIKATITVDNFTFYAFTIHTRPEDAVVEIDNLFSYADALPNDPVIVLGDLNADCLYYDENNKTSFKNWQWIVPDNQDTSTSTTDCTYDRIIADTTIYPHFIEYGVVPVEANLSDHSIIWARFRP